MPVIFHIPLLNLKFYSAPTEPTKTVVQLMIDQFVQNNKTEKKIRIKIVWYEFVTYGCDGG